MLDRETNVAIAAALFVDEGTVRNDIKRLQELWLEQTKHEQALLRAQVVAKLHHAQELSLEAARFDQDAERAVLYGADKDGKPVSIERDEKGSASFKGNKAAALANYRQAVMDEAKVLGIIVDKAALTDAQGNGLTLAALIAIARKD